MYAMPYPRAEMMQIPKRNSVPKIRKRVSHDQRQVLIDELHRLQEMERRGRAAVVRKAASVLAVVWREYLPEPLLSALETAAKANDSETIYHSLTSALKGAYGLDAPA